MVLAFFLDRYPSSFYMCTKLLNLLKASQCPKLASQTDCS